jgi:hypothetical protein
MNFTDTNHSYGIWPWTQSGSTSAARLGDRLSSEGITEAWVASTQALLAEDIAAAERRMFRDLEGEDRVRFARTLNPLHGGCLAMYRAALADERCVAVRLAPTIHRFRLFDASLKQLGEIMQAEGDLPVQILVRFDDLRQRAPSLATIFSERPSRGGAMAAEIEPVEVLSFAQRFPRLRILVQGATLQEAIRLAGGHTLRHGTNIWVDTSFFDGLAALGTAADLLPQEKIVFGTAEPFLYARANVLHFLDPSLPSSFTDAVARGNAAALERSGLSNISRMTR